MIKSYQKDDGTVFQVDEPESSLFNLLSKIKGNKKDELGELLRKYPNYVGHATDIGKIKNGKKTGEKAITILVKKKLPKSSLASYDLFPEQINGIKTDVYEYGEVMAPRPLPPKGKGKVKTQALMNPTEYQKKYRPIPNGVSVGNTTITAGTIGGIATINGVKHIMTNTHVACQYINKDLGGQVRDVVQPGPYDGGSVADGKGYTAKAIIMPDGQVAYNDFAAVRLDTLGDATCKTLQTQITPSGMGTLAVGDRVWKEGRTTGLTFGNVLSLSATVSVNYGTVNVTHVACILVTDLSDGGDSGSWIYKKVSPGDTISDADRQVVAYLFAGSSQNTVCHEIQNGMSALGATLVTDSGPTPPPTKDVQVDAILTKQTGGDTFRVYGTVADTDGNLVANCSVLVTGTSSTSVITRNATTGSDGKYSVENCPYQQGYTFKVDFVASGYNSWSYDIGGH